MEVDKYKCLICEVSCGHKGLAFFKFPKEESRLKMWIKEISPLLDILKISQNSLKENGRICARHFRERDFSNSKQNSLVHNACPSLSVSNLTLSFQTENEESFLEDVRSSDESEKDIFQCGRCKAQFEVLSEFTDHKRLKCQPTNEKATKSTTETTEIPFYNYLLPPENSTSGNNDNRLIETVDQEMSNCSEKVIKIISQESASDNKIVSLVMNENGAMVGNPFDISSFCSQVILTSQLPISYNGMTVSNPIDLSLASQVIVSPQTPVDNSVLLNNVESDSQFNSLLITADGTNSLNKDVIYSCPVQNNDGVVVPSEIQTNHVVLTNKIPNLPIPIKDSDQMLTFCKLTNISNASQLSLLHLQEKNDMDEVEKSNPTGECGFEKLKTKIPCSYCGKKFEKPFNLQQHERVHTGERPFQCIICGRAFSQKSNVRKHMMRHRVWPMGKQTLKMRNEEKEEQNKEVVNRIDYSCQYCTLSFKSYAEHKKHMAVHSNYKVYRCIQKDCNETFSDVDEFLSHSKMHSLVEFHCHICLKVFTNLEELGVHQYDHDATEKEKQKYTKIKLKCRVCNARFKTSVSLKNHLAVDTHNYECFHCKRVFCSERYLRRHLFIHMDSSQSKFKCPNCKKTFRTEQNLKNHVFIHLEEKPFNCDHCDKQFASKYRLKRHVAIHLNQYLECPFKKHLGCDKTFYRKDKLREHITTHSHCGVRSCRICSKMYWTLSKQHQHMQKEHKRGSEGKEVLKCITCSQIFRKQKQLSHHYCAIEGRKSNFDGKNYEWEEKEKSSETVSNIEIIMVPFGANGENLN